MENNNSIDMLHGGLAKKLIFFALPLAVSSTLQQMFNIADLAIVGRFDSSTAMAAVGSNAALVDLMISLFTGMSLGANVTVAALIGEHKSGVDLICNENKINDAVHVSIFIGILSGILILIIGEITAPVLLALMSVPTEVMPLALGYLRIFFFAMPFIMIYDFGSSVLRSKGDSKRPLNILILSGVLNVALNTLFVIVLGMSVNGVAIATVISNALSAALILIILHKEEPDFRLNYIKYHLKKEHRVYFFNIIKIGLPTGLQWALFSLSSVIIQSAINEFGAAAIAGSAAAQNFEYIVYYIINAFASAAATFTSQNYAAGLFDRCKKIYVQCSIIGMLCGFAFGLLFWIFERSLLGLFSENETVIEFACIRMVEVCLLEFMAGTFEISGGCMRGMGNSILPTSLTIIGSCFFRFFWIWSIFPHMGSMEGLLLVYPATWIITGIAVTVAMFGVRKKYFNRKEEELSIEKI